MKSFSLYLILCALPLYADFGVKTRAELHGKYQNLNFGIYDYLLYERFEKAVFLPKEWQLYLRLDIPFLWLKGSKTELVEVDLDGAVADAPRKTTLPVTIPVDEKGLSDILIRGFFVTPPMGNLTLGFGSELIFPSAQAPEIGTGKYLARPLAGFKYDFPNLASGGWAAFLLKYLFSFAGNSHRPSLSIFYMQPVFICTYKSWIFSSSPEAQLNCKTNQWFVPFAITLGKSFQNRLTLAVQYQKGLITDFPVFEEEYEVTLSCLF